MFAASVAFVTALLAGVVLTPLARLAARRHGVVDHPDGRRKLHCGPVPLWGGVAVYLALSLGLVAAGLIGRADQSGLVDLAPIVALTAGGVCLIGCVDDRLDLKPRFKLLLQTAATIPVIMAGYWVQRIALFGYSIDLGWSGALLTMFWLVACINAVNLLDGMDGLASMVGVFSALSIALIAAIGGHLQVTLIAVALAGALAGFLAYNLPPASIYLGDSGSMVIGLVVGVLAFQGSLTASAALSITVPLLVMTIPMLDAVLAVTRRRLSGRPFDAADRGHIHHRLLSQGLTQWQSLGVIGTLCLITGTAAIAAAAWGNDALAWITAGGVVLLLVTTRAFGNHELALIKLAGAHAVSRSVRRLVESRRARRTIVRQSMLAGMPFDQAWSVLVDEVRRWQGRRIELEVTGADPRQSHRQVWVDEAESSLSCIHWSLAMMFSGPDRRTCYLKVSGSDAGISQQWTLVQLMRLLRPFGEHWTVRSEDSRGVAVPMPSPEIPARAGSLGRAATGSRREAA
ncbi:MAG: hypothetical protein A2W31_09420 [Planctomycetes bacterium RBG_16_64_10]|nr:MAG: hypothetical protein A2W31_09420 [Planctomycetes bacterium RBG_16_64_10]